MRTHRLIAAALLPLGLAAAMSAASGAAADAAAPKRVTVTGEVIDSWCYLSEIMWALGSAHHQCAVWCAAGGVPVGILGEDQQVYIVLKLEDDPGVLENPRIMQVQTDKVTVEGDLYERDSVKYLAIDRVVDNQGIVNRTHDKHDIQPFGN
ncbi:MAG: hypothetical protein AB7P52_11310 [Alphaproteobacteria bacterium]